MKDLIDIRVWKKQLGLLPINLNPRSKDEGHMMLNGGNGDFCLKTTNNDFIKNDLYSKSWSSGTKNFITVANGNINIYNWLNDKTEIVRRDVVAENLDKFYNYLLSKSYKSSKDIVPFIIDIFRQFRNLTNEKSNPVQALNLLFSLLASLEDDMNNLSADKWGIENVDIPKNFDSYVDRLYGGLSNIKPDLDLIIRHSAGVLFQEAQKEVLFFDHQKDLFGGVSNSLSTKANLYSSIHYTPPFLSRTVVENSLRNINLKSDKIKIFDPACGSSEFLVEALKQLNELDYKGKIEVHGSDISETAINTSKFLLTYEKRTIWKDKLEFELNLVEDSLTENWDNDYDLILMNPPFTSWELLNTKDRREAIREALGTSFIGKKPNQASAFFRKAIDHLNDDGVIGCVIPSSILTLDSYSKLRKDINEFIDIKLLGKLGNFIFEDALTDVSFFIGKKPKTRSSSTIIWTRNEKGVAQEALRDLRKSIYNNQITFDSVDFSIYQPISFPILMESWKPVSLRENEFLKAIKRFELEKKLVTIKEVFNVKQGINSGNNKLFKISKLEYSEIPNDEKKYFKPVVDNGSIENFKLIPNKYVWYPYDQNGIMIKSEEEFEKKAPQFYAKLIPFKKILSDRARKNEDNWWHLSEHRNWLLKSEPRLVSARFGNSNSFAFDQEGNYIVENGNAWLPKKEFSENDYYFYLAIFTSSFFDKLLSIHSKQLSGGKWFDLGRKYSQWIQVPNVNSSEVRNSDGYLILADIGREVFQGNYYAKSISDKILEQYFYPNH